MQFDTPFQLIRTLEGNTLKILLALLFARKQHMGAMGEQKLQTITGLAQNTVRHGLDTLELYDLVVRNDNLWALSDGARQLPLMDMFGLGSGQELATLPTVEIIEAPSQKLTRHEVESEQASQKLTRGAAETVRVEPKKTVEVAETAIFEAENASIESKNDSILTALDSRSNLDSGLDLESISIIDMDPILNPDLEQHKKEVFAELDRWGITGKVRDEIAGIEYVSAAMIAHYCSKAQKVGYAIWRLRHHLQMVNNPKWAREVYRESQPVVYAAPKTTQPVEVELQEISETIWERWDEVMADLEKMLPCVEFDTWIKSATLKRANQVSWVIGMFNSYAIAKFEQLALAHVREMLSGIEITIEVL